MINRKREDNSQKMTKIYNELRNSILMNNKIINNNFYKIKDKYDKSSKKIRKIHKELESEIEANEERFLNEENEIDWKISLQQLNDNYFSVPQKRLSKFSEKNEIEFKIIKKEKNLKINSESHKKKLDEFCVKIRKKETKIFELNNLAAEKFEEDINFFKRDVLDNVVIDYDSYASNKTIENGLPLNKKLNETGGGNKGFFGLCGADKKSGEEPGCNVF